MIKVLKRSNIKRSPNLMVQEFLIKPGFCVGGTELLSAPSIRAILTTKRAVSDLLRVCSATQLSWKDTLASWIPDEAHIYERVGIGHWFQIRF